MSFYNNGYVIKNYSDQMDYKYRYAGIAKGVSWPLSNMNDDLSISLTEEANERWFGYQDDRLWTIPDHDFLKRYLLHCRELNISTSVLKIETDNSIIVSKNLFEQESFLGYDYSDVDMETSCFYDDITMDNKFVENSFSVIKNKLNNYGLLETASDISLYLNISEKLIIDGYDMEQYYHPTVVKLTKVDNIRNDSV